jgi:endogenous inhibitor of DNA gyrase (YacG/DUF329 family)
VPSEEAATSRQPRCPRCGSARAWEGNPHRPFCGLTCRLIDLGRWLDERYRVAGNALPEEFPPDDDRPPRPPE